jgi:hypothetical protein
MKQVLCRAVLVSLLPVLGCLSIHHSPASSSRAEPQGASTGQAVVEVHNIRYDGSFLSGRFLVGVKQGLIRLDKRLVENVSINVESVSDCATGQQVGYFFTDSFPPPPTTEDLLVLRPGQWYGVDFRYPLFAERATGQPSPDCIKVKLLLRSFDEAELAETLVQANREAPAPPEPGAGTSTAPQHEESGSAP